MHAALHFCGIHTYISKENEICELTFNMYPENTLGHVPGDVSGFDFDSGGSDAKLDAAAQHRRAGHAHWIARVI